MGGIAVITGGAGGMGFATAALLGRDRRLVLADTSRARLDTAVGDLAGRGIEALGVVADVTDAEAVAALYDAAAAEGTIDAVVHTAGLSPQMGSAEEIIRVNACGTVHVTRAALAIAHEGFAIVNVASMAGYMFPSALLPRRAYRHARTDPDRMLRTMIRATRRVPASVRSGLAYAISKNFVSWYSADQATLFGARGGRILSVSPGSFDTAMGRLEARSGSAAMVEHAALKRFGRPEEIAELLAFCAGDRAGYLTGTDILCDGGTRAGIRGRDLIALARRR